MNVLRGKISDLLITRVIRFGKNALLKITNTDGTESEVSLTELKKLASTGDTLASGTTAAKIDDPTGGATVDAEARAAINAIIDALETFKVSSN